MNFWCQVLSLSVTDWMESRWIASLVFLGCTSLSDEMLFFFCCRETLPDGSLWGGLLLKWLCSGRSYYYWIFIARYIFGRLKWQYAFHTVDCLLPYTRRGCPQAPLLVLLRGRYFHQLTTWTQQAQGLPWPLELSVYIGDRKWRQLSLPWHRYLY
jgi:hypothetical protein